MKNRIFIDAFTDISLSNGLVRVNFSNVADKEGELEVSNELIMPPAAFLKAFGAMEDLVNKLIADGIIAKNNNKQEAKSQEKTNDTITVSPNFG